MDYLHTIVHMCVYCSCQEGGGGLALSRWEVAYIARGHATMNHTIQVYKPSALEADLIEQSI